MSKDFRAPLAWSRSSRKQHGMASKCRQSVNKQPQASLSQRASSKCSADLARGDSGASQASGCCLSDAASAEAAALPS